VKILSIIFLSLSCSLAIGQNTFKIQAQKIEFPYSDWNDIKPTEANGLPWVYDDVTCYGFSSVKSSSSLAPQGSKNYKSSNLSDDNPTTAWVEGKEGYGLGEWFEIDANYMTTGEFTILNGYQSSKSAYQNNSRVKKLVVFLNGKEIGDVQLLDYFGAQTFRLPTKNIHGMLKFVIVDVYKGLKYSDTAISEFYSCEI
jgi:hypothetical protein